MLYPKAWDPHFLDSFTGGSQLNLTGNKEIFQFFRVFFKRIVAIKINPANEKSKTSGHPKNIKTPIFCNFTKESRADSPISSTLSNQVE